MSFFILKLRMIGKRIVLKADTINGSEKKTVVLKAIMFKEGIILKVGKTM